MTTLTQTPVNNHDATTPADTRGGGGTVVTKVPGRRKEGTPDMMISDSEAATRDSSLGEPQ